jgi:hypothetical protein
MVLVDIQFLDLTFDNFDIIDIAAVILPNNCGAIPSTKTEESSSEMVKSKKNYSLIKFLQDEGAYFISINNIKVFKEQRIE